MIRQLRATNIDSSCYPIGLADVLVYAVGYESRSSYLIRTYDIATESVFGVIYSISHTHSFEANLAFLRTKGFRNCSATPENIEVELSSFIRTKQSEKVVISVAIDVSSMDRSIMSAVLHSILGLMRPLNSLAILYTPSEFSQPNLELYPIKAFGAAHPGISGVVSDPTRARALILGLGYEYGISLSILDMHEPDTSFIFRPLGFDERFVASVAEANFNFDFGERSYEVIDYHLNDAAGLYDDLSGLVLSMKHNTAIVCVPFGPKLFSAVCVLVAFLHAPSISVLRYSTTSSPPISDVTALPHVVGVSFREVLHSAGNAYEID